LQRLAFLVGSVDVREGMLDNQARAQNTANDVLGIPFDGFRRVIRCAGDEYKATRGMFEDVADAVRNVDSLLDTIHTQMAAALEKAVFDNLRAETASRPARFRLGGFEIEIEALSDGLAAA